MEFNKKFLGLFSLVTLSACATIAATLAWFSGNEIEVETEGYTASSYYARGTGTAEDPFIINNPVHLYNLSWLQYLGTYNAVKNNSIDQYYFEVEKDIDMSGYVIPPIGTTDNPFVGNFKGNGHVISNLTTSNIMGEGEIVKKPLGISATQLTGVNVVGFFGVVGDFEGKYSDASTEITYDTSVNKVDGFILDKADIHNKLDNALVGIVAGYVNGNIDNVSVVDSNVNIKNGTAAYKVNASSDPITNNISDYTTVGFATPKFRTKVNKGKTDVSDAAIGEHVNLVHQGAGDQQGWGGSIGMDEIYKRLETLRSSNAPLKTQFSLPREKTAEFHYFNNGVEDLTKEEETYSAQANQNSYEYFNENAPLQGRVTFGQTQQNYLWGKRTYTRDYVITNEYHTDADEVCYYAKSGNYYLRFTGGNAARTQTEADKTMLFVDADGWVYYKYNNGSYYLYAKDNKTNTTTLQSSNKKQNYMFKVSGSQLRLYQVSNGAAQDRYVTYSNSNANFNIGGTGSNILTQTTNYRTETITDHQITYSTHGSYLPLNVYTKESQISDYDKSLVPNETLTVNCAKPSNSGYIVGGTKSMTDNYGSAVRVASNYDYSDINRALGGSNTYSGSNLQILTQTKNSNGVVFIEDDFNKNVALSNNLKSLTYVSDKTEKHNYEALGLEKYKDSRAHLDSQFKANTSNLYVMRFNEFQISMENTIIADKVLLNGEVKNNYVFPESCIDFNLKEKGYINFFGGGFRGGSCNAFFSLFHVIRDTNDNITSLKHLAQIYGTNVKKDPYVYKYADGTYAIYDKESKTYTTTSLPSGYSLQFDLNWVEAPGFTAVDNTMWYFEIPVNEGEYALGAVDGRTGAYMMYLDVGANAEQINRSTFTQNTKVEFTVMEYPEGISVSASNTAEYISGDSVAVAIKTGASGDINLSRMGDEYKMSGSQTYYAPSYINPGGEDTNEATLVDASDEEIPLVPLSSENVICTYVYYIDYNQAVGDTIVTILTRKVGTVDGENVDERTYSIKTIDGQEYKDQNIYDNEGKVVELANAAISSDTCATLSDLYSFEFVNNGTISFETLMTYVEASASDDSSVYYDFTGNDILVVTDAGVVLKVTIINTTSGYVLKINDTAITASGNINIPATSTNA